MPVIDSIEVDLSHSPPQPLQPALSHATSYFVCFWKYRKQTNLFFSFKIKSIVDEKYFGKSFAEEFLSTFRSDTHECKPYKCSSLPFEY